MKRIALLGATGSIGTQTLDVIRRNTDIFKLVSMSLGKNIVLGRKIIQEFKPKVVSVISKDDCDTLKLDYPDIEFYYGVEGLTEVATHKDADIVITAVMGSVGLNPTLAAIECKKTIGLANKETLVTAGHLVMESARRNNVQIIPVDSEHSAIFQCLQGEVNNEINRIILTASGGSFRDKNRDELNNVTVKDALNHPNWSMGAKITIDSATMLNKGLEVIEAHWLFDLPYDKIEVLLHKESIIHSMVEFKDTSVIAQLGNPDMRVPIQYAITYPNRLKLVEKPLNLWEISTLNFKKLDFNRYPGLRLSYEAGKASGTMPTVLNAANEVAVEAFLQNKIKFLEIEEIIENALNMHTSIHNPDIYVINEVDEWTRRMIYSKIK
ncbi:MAG: 1-deoxy-D-xylulose-5-phosphate reductoisomerase [Bacillales bacterium]|nr:1-deoxy-D-xylulose-5-phosphate reductoisomerase [Bacillales bacterium]